MQIPILGGAYEGRSTGNNSQQSVNLFPVTDNTGAKNKIAMYHTPGLSEGIDIGYEARNRGMWMFRDNLYVVLGNRVYMIETDDTVTQCTGEVLTTTDAYVQIADNYLSMMIVDGSYYPRYITYDAPTVVKGFPAAAYQASAGVAFLNGFYIIFEPGTADVYISGAYDVTDWDATRVKKAESNSDNLVGLGTTTQNMWFFGTESTEIWYPIADDFFPMARVPNGVLDVGCAAQASIATIEGRLYWLTNDGECVRTNGMQYERISQEGMEYQISTFTDKASCTGWGYSLEGETFYVLSFPTTNRTFCFNINSGYWHEWNRPDTA